MTVKKIYDLAVIGGGINGAGIANNAAGRGLSVVLFEKDDLASATSSASTKLIHGGLRYLEQYEFRLVRESLKEREVLLNKAPHIIWPLQFVMPHNSHLRPFWMIKIGLWLYDHLSRLKSLPKSYSVDLSQHKYGEPVQKDFKRGFVYSDCWVEDARLVVLNAMQAQNQGAKIYTRTEVTQVIQDKEGYLIQAKDKNQNQIFQIRAKGLVNAAGPWVQQVIEGAMKQASGLKIKLVKGSHIIVPRLYSGEQAYILQNPDKRIIFAIPYEKDFHLIGTTDVALSSIPEQIEISAEEKDYLIKHINRYFKKQLDAGDIKASFAGIRPLFSDAHNNPSEITRDYHLDLQVQDGHPLLNVFGGKITTYRRLAEAVLKKLSPYYLNIGKSWTRTAKLPGGDFSPAEFESYFMQKKARYAFLPPDLVYRYLRYYGSDIEKLLDGVKTQAELGICFGSDLYQREVEYLCQYEFAQTAEDIIWRRTKCALAMNHNEIEQLKQFLLEKR